MPHLHRCAFSIVLPLRCDVVNAYKVVGEQELFSYKEVAQFELFNLCVSYKHFNSTVKQFEANISHGAFR